MTTARTTLAIAIAAPAFASVLGGAPRAHAQPSDGGAEPGTARFEYTAPSGCPDAGAFVQAVLSHGAVLRAPAEGRRAERVARVALEATRGAAVARLTLVDDRGRSVERTVAAHDCREASDAIALVAALALQSPPTSSLHASTTGGAATTSSAVAATSAATAAGTTSPPTVSSTSPTPSSTATAALASAPPPEGAPRGTLAQQAPSAEQEAAPAWSLRGLAGALAVTGAAPNLAPGLSAELAIERYLPRPVRAVSLALGAAATLDEGVATSQGRATFGLRAATGALCVGSWAPLSRTALVPCVVGELGVLQADGSGTLNPRSSTRPWAACGAGGTATYSLSPHWFVELAARALVALDRDRFELGSADAFQTPAFVARARFAVGTTLP